MAKRADRASHDALARRMGRRHWRGMVRWFDPRLLLRTLFSLVVARIFASYADRRELDYGHPLDGPYDYGAQQEIWLDYVADLGDGWDSTATVAGLLAADRLDFDGEHLPHGRLLLMGGDEVYPVASREEYLHRTEAPYYSQHPRSPDDDPRDLFVLPGNHDWYDGLAAFSRLFLQKRWFAGWLTRQTRSYFVLRLPQRWWIVAVDVQLDYDIDVAQLNYLVDATAAIRPGDRVVLMSAVPFWLEEEGSVLRRNMAFIERRLVSERGARVYLALSGDLHHYTRYAEDDGTQRITAGGGGAFMHGTAWLPERIADGDTHWRREQAFPSPGISRFVLWRLLAFPMYNPSFALFLGIVSMLLLWSADAASHGIFFANAALGASVSPGALLSTVPASPAFALLLAGWFAAFVAFSEEPVSAPRRLRRPLKTLLGMAHALLHLLLALFAVSVVLPSRLLDPLSFIGTLLLLASFLAVGSGWLFGVWTWVVFQLFGCHHETAYSACRIRDWKNFLRIHIDSAGVLTIHVVGVRRVCRAWTEHRPVAAGESFVVPGDGVPLSQRAFLVERVSIRPDPE